LSGGFNPSDSNFNIAIGLSESTVLPPSIGRFEAVYADYRVTGDKGLEQRSKEKRPLPLVKCSSLDWKIEDEYKNQLESTIDSLLCIEPEVFKELNLAGNYFANKF
jgi:hypothetical protein